MFILIRRSRYQQYFLKVLGSIVSADDRLTGKKFTTGIYWIPKIADYYLDLFPLIRLILTKVIRIKVYYFLIYIVKVNPFIRQQAFYR